MRPRSLLFHFLFLLISAGCLVAAWWQIHRAADGNTLSYLYSIEWPAFVVVGGIGWWQLVHDTDEDIVRRRDYHARIRRASAEVVARTLPRSVLALTVDSHEVGTRSLPPTTGNPEAAGTSLEPIAGASPVLAPEEAPSGDDELDDYNRYLAFLAVKGRAKTWRNPRGES